MLAFENENIHSNVKFFKENLQLIGEVARIRMLTICFKKFQHDSIAQKSEKWIIIICFKSAIHEQQNIEIFLKTCFSDVISLVFLYKHKRD